MEEKILLSLSKTELESLIENAVRKVMNEIGGLKPAVEENHFLSVKETADYLKLTPPTIYGLVSRMEIPYCKKGKRLYFPQKDLEKWLMEGRRKTRREIELEVDEYIVGRKRRFSRN